MSPACADLSQLESSRSPASFRDPAGFVFAQDGLWKRAVTHHGREDYEHLMDSGLYRILTARGWLVPHREEPGPDDLHKVLVPEQIRHISYPYEWSFAQWKDAALLTLDIQSAALRCGMSLKDASAFNVQFDGPRAVFIDTLSFERNPGGPWAAYGQFCAHFLAPLALMACVSVDLGRHFRVHLDGFPLELVSRLLPRSTWLRMGLLLHLHLHARSQAKYRGGKPAPPASGADRKQVVADSLRSAVESLKLPRAKTEWIGYYHETTHYSEAAQRAKLAEVERAAEELRPELVYDLGGNTGAFARALTRRGIDCVCYDADPLCVNENYLRAKAEGDRHMLPLLLDLTDPSPAAGFGLEERSGTLDRARPDLALALALIHHLRFTANVPLARIARFLARLAPAALVEWVPPEDPMARRLMGNRSAAVFEDYSWRGFQDAFGREFRLVRTAEVPDSGRRLCLFKK